MSVKFSSQTRVDHAYDVNTCARETDSNITISKTPRKILVDNEYD